MNQEQIPPVIRHQPDSPNRPIRAAVIPMGSDNKTRAIAGKALASMPRNTRELVRSKIDALAADPVGVANVKKLVGRDGYRLRVDGWRVIYTLEAGRQVVFVMHIGARGGVYK